MKSKWVTIVLLNVIGLFFVIYDLVNPVLILLILMVTHFIFYRHMTNFQIKRYESELFRMESTSKTHMRFSQVQASQLETIIQNLPFPIALIDVSGKFTITNENFDGFYKEKPIHYNQVCIYDEVYNFVRVAYLKEEELRQNMRLDAMDIQAINVPIYEGQRYSGTLLMFLDVTTLLEGERMQKRFIADASHELRTPLTSILGMIEILNRPRFNDTETLKDFLVQIEEESKRMESIIKDLIDLSKQSNTKIVLNTKEYLARELIDKAIQSVHSEIEKHQNKIMVSCSESLKLHVDAQKFHQVLTNLISNAAKYTTKGQIKLSLYQNETQTIIEISDSGIGISSEDQNHIFDRFFRSDSSRSRASGGSGLGLAIVKMYVLMHQGEISVKSKLNEGSTFTVYLPRP